MKSDILSIFRKSVEGIQVSLKSDKNNGYLTWWPMYSYYNILLNSSYNKKLFRQSCRESQNTHFMFNNFFFWKSRHLWDNVEKYGRDRQATDDNIIQHMHFACWITKATNTHSECVMLLAFPWQQWLCECTSMLHMYVHCLSCNIILQSKPMSSNWSVCFRFAHQNRLCIFIFPHAYQMTCPSHPPWFDYLNYIWHGV
jgi:hypothetical protein